MRIPSSQKKNSKQVSCNLLSGDESSSISIKLYQAVNSEALQHPVTPVMQNKRMLSFRNEK